ncbi:synaptonemal complex central element protein 1 isoform X2 [Boleophthalmus pectinirostris]|uniref:synaptonemal complex central element protein 1 isoform X2 n=1 Tax=Boleophthalmus pectinirostris TaxID=150288 RepID=UPI00242C94CF|nr:synaptonemal complex central element protein 1 isoform X2 [Boleophthalmus pectinirostris]
MVETWGDAKDVYKSALGEEIQEIQAIKESLQKEFETVQAESLQLEVIHKEKEELCQKLQYLCEESEQDFARQLKHNKSTEDLSEQYKCEIQAIKLKHRKLRMKFENHLYQLIEQKKNLYSVFMPDRIPAEIENAENTKSQLSNAEKLKATQVNSLEEEIEKWKQEKQDPQSVVVQEE